MSQQTITPEFRPLGVDAIAVRFSRVLTDAANARALAFRDQVEAAKIAGVTEIAPSLVSVKIGFDPAITDRATVLARLEPLAQLPATADTAPRKLWRIPTAFGPAYAPQLQETAAQVGISTDKAVSEICAQTVRVLAIGFAAGQSYLGMLPKQWNVPRQSTLTDSLPRGALISAVRQLIIWAADTPTGWRHIGQTAFEVYRPQMETPFAFEPGDAVQFVAVSDAEFEQIAANNDPDGGATCEVLR